MAESGDPAGWESQRTRQTETVLERVGGGERGTDKMESTVAASVLPPRSSNVFVYGSLMADEVVEALLKRIPKSSPAILNDFHRFSIKGRVYPAISPVENKKVTGRVLLDITDPELDTLDAFEDVEYERVIVEVFLTDGSGKLKVSTYVWGNKNDPDLYGDWDFDEWKGASMADFVRMTSSFMEEELPQCKTRVDTYGSFFQLGDGRS